MPLGIKFSPSELTAAIAKVEEIAALDMTSAAAIEAQSALIVEIRKLLVSVPNDIIKPSQHLKYLSEVRGDLPPSKTIEFLSKKERSLRLTEDEIVRLERQQMGRCSCCGVLLETSVRPNIDHKRPLALGGEDELENLQILCEECNSGKGMLLHWVMAAPWFIRRNAITNRLRYCVLKWFKSRCSVDECSNDASNSKLLIDLRIPRARGGQPIFDNLCVVCEHHYELAIHAREHQARNQLRKLGSKGPTLSLPVSPPRSFAD
jgi:hypothetical protein